MKNPTSFLTAALVWFAIMNVPAVVDACPNCKDALDFSRAIAFGTSVLLLMGMPFLIGAFWWFAIFRTHTRIVGKQ